LNYQPKVIGLFVSAPGHNQTRGFFVPCLPSPISKSSTKTIYMDDKLLWNNNYNTTIKQLKQLKNKNGEILCAPRLKIIDDNLVVGILTETNQFIQISPPESPENIDNELETIDHSNYLIPEKILTTSKKGDSERERTIRKISIESQFYQVFRTQMRILLNIYDKRRLRQHILDCIKETELTYKQKLLSITKDLKEISNDAVLFQDMSLDVAMSFGEITGCLDSKNKPYCLIRETDKTTQLILPKLNLMSGIDNEKLYFGRLSDEFVRYQRIRIFMFQPKKYLNIQTNMKYSINKDEFLTMESTSNDYFQEPFNTSSFIHNTNYNTANPKTTQYYSNEISLNEQNKIMTKNVANDNIMVTPLITSNKKVNKLVDENERLYNKLKPCIDIIRDVVGSHSIWKQSFPNTAEEIIFVKSPQCSFTPFQYILQAILSREITILELKEVLIKGYKKIEILYHPKILLLLSKQGKRNMMKSVKNIEDLVSLIIDEKEEYYITDLDAWILAREYSIPLILFSPTTLKNMVATNWLFIGPKITSLYSPLYFLRSPPNIEHQYSLISKPYKHTELNKFSTVIQSAIDGDEKYMQNIQTLEEFLYGLEAVL
jgi:hypothetical protein